MVGSVRVRVLGLALGSTFYAVRLQRVDITYDEPGPDEAKRPFPLYSIVYSNDPLSEATFSI